MHPSVWANLASEIYALHDKFDGFVVLHGTDTMAFTASALSFMLRGLKKPVIITGSQLPVGVLRTDAVENLLSALEFAAMEAESVRASHSGGLVFILSIQALPRKSCIQKIL